MTFLKDVVNPGDKVKIFMKQPVKKKDGTEKVFFETEVLDITEEGNIAVAIPTRKTKTVLFPFDVVFVFTFFTKSGIYKCEIEIINRYKIQNLSFMVLSEKTRIKKIQRREYYRLACTLDMNYYLLTQEESTLNSAEEIFNSMRENGIDRLRERKATIVDISGGGLRFASKEQVGRENYILINVALCTGEMEKEFYIVAKVIASYKNSNDHDIYNQRVEFIFKDNKIRDVIIRYVYQEQRRSRKKKK
jgi:c-di-GMP-binding flagellar brake protein YcgR